MQNITKISDITYEDLVYFLRLPDPPSADDINFLNSCIDYAHSYIQYYTGRTSAELDNFKDIISAFFLHTNYGGHTYFGK